MNSKETCAHCRDDANEVIALNSLMACEHIGIPRYVDRVRIRPENYLDVRTPR